MKTPVTRKGLHDHFTYSWWKYILLCVLAFMTWSIFYATTAYQPPEEKKVILGVYGVGAEENITAYMQQVQSIHLPEMEAVEQMYILPDQQYGDMILMTRVAGNECDVYVLPTQQFQSWANQGACQPLEIVLPGLIDDLTSAEISLSRGRRQNEALGEKHIYGIPCRDLPGADHLLGMNTDDMYICVFHNTGNDENVLRFLDIFVHDLMNEPPATPTDLAPAP